VRSGLLIAASLVVAAAGLGFGGIQLRRAQSEAARLRALEQEVAAVQAQVAALHSEASRAVERETVLRLIAEDRAQQEQAKKKELDRLVEERSLVWSQEVAKTHGLTDEQRRGLLEVFELQRSKSDEWIRRMAAAPMDTDALNRIYHELVDWRLAELEKRLDAPTALEINRDPFWLAALELPGADSR
jgi:hypothetical protein